MFGVLVLGIFTVGGTCMFELLGFEIGLKFGTLF
jgi:hypothetical protein